MTFINGHEVDTATYLADERAFEEGHTSYIRPVYNRFGHFEGFAVYVSGEAVGKVFEQYKLASQLLEQIRSEALAA